MANPQVRPHLHFYPEDAGDELSEARQGTRWLHSLPPELTTPYADIAGQTYYTFELALTVGNRLVVPVRWFMKAGILHAQCWDVEVSDESGDPVWRAVLPDAPNRVRILSSRQFLKPFPEVQRDLQVHPGDYAQIYGRLPSSLRIQGIVYLFLI